MQPLLIIGSSPQLQSWVFSSEPQEHGPIVLCATPQAALGRIQKGLRPGRVLLEGRPGDAGLLAAAALLQFSGCRAPVAFIDFAVKPASAPTIVCAVEGNQRVLACQLQLNGQAAIAPDAQVLFDYQAPCTAAAGRGKN